MAQIRVERLQKSFGDFAAVKGSTFAVRDGEFFCLLGPSGCGKTTTLFLVPILVFTVLLRKHLLRGITFGAVRK